MNQAVKNLIDSILEKFGVGMSKSDTLKRLREDAKAAEDIDLLLALPRIQAPQLLDNLRKSKSQFRQDLFVLSELEFKREGFFVEFGATNGLYLSNTWLLEKEFGWTGILAEPARFWHDRLRDIRSAFIETDCVWSASNAVLSFNEVQFPELSTIGLFGSGDTHGAYRKRGRIYDVKTVSLNDLLEKYKAPQTIDYLSIDTEGSEFEILNGFDFSRHRFRVITCEHNHTPLREKIYNLLGKNGYVRKFPEISKADDWYVGVCS